MEDTAARLGMRVLGFLSKPVSLDALLGLFEKHEGRATPASATPDAAGA
jgi:hypothetical protein